LLAKKAIPKISSQSIQQYRTNVNQKQRWKTICEGSVHGFFSISANLLREIYLNMTAEQAAYTLHELRRKVLGMKGKEGWQRLWQL
jgi:hypothetical protein